MQAEDLINNMDVLGEEAYNTESKRIESELKKRYAELYEQYK